MDNELTLLEMNRLADIEGRIERGARLLYCGLVEIYDNNLWRGGYSTFGDYCETRWGISRATSYRTLSAMRVMAKIEGKIEDDIPAPTLGQAAELAKLPEEDQAGAWEEAVETAPKKDGEPNVTKKHVATTVKNKSTVNAESTAKPDYQADIDTALKHIGQATRRLASVAERAGTELPSGIVGSLTSLNKELLTWRESL